MYICIYMYIYVYSPPKDPSRDNTKSESITTRTPREETSHTQLHQRLAAFLASWQALSQGPRLEKAFLPLACFFWSSASRVMLVCHSIACS